jgi:hypothetical protein
MKIFFVFVLFFLNALSFEAQRTVGVLPNGGKSQKGYVLFAPLYSQTTYLIDKNGAVVHSWKSKWLPSQSVYLLKDGTLLRTANDSTKFFSAGGGLIEKIDWGGNVLWSYSVSDFNQRQHHDICPLPNGNILVLAWEKKTKEEAIAAGRDPKLLGDVIWSEKIIELKPLPKNTAAIVWEWHVWDHLVQDFDTTKKNFGKVADSPGSININYLASTAEDWLHFNALAFNQELNQIVVSNRNFSEIFVIDHSTTIQSARLQAGGRCNKGGSLLYRWGNPAAYNMGSAVNQQFFQQHNAYWIEKGKKDQGKIMVFNNGLNREGDDYSSVEILSPALTKNGTYEWKKGRAYLPDSVYWQYKPELANQFFSYNASGAQRISNGSTLICEGAKGRFFEIDVDKNVVWEYVNPVKYKGVLKQGEVLNQNQVFRCTFYPPDYPGLIGRALKPGDTIEKTQ